MPSVSFRNKLQSTSISSSFILLQVDLQADSIKTSKAFSYMPSTVHGISLVVLTSYFRNLPNEENTGLTDKLGSMGSSISY